MEDGGHAFPGFPHPTEQTVLTLQLGMSLRDYFADSAMHALRIDSDTQALADTLNMSYETYVARMAYIQADAMLIERKKGA